MDDAIIETTLTNGITIVPRFTGDIDPVTKKVTKIETLEGFDFIHIFLGNEQK